MMVCVAASTRRMRLPHGVAVRDFAVDRVVGDVVVAELCYDCSQPGLMVVKLSGTTGAK